MTTTRATLGVFLHIFTLSSRRFSLFVFVLVKTLICSSSELLKDAQFVAAISDFTLENSKFTSQTKKDPTTDISSKMQTKIDSLKNWLSPFRYNCIRFKDYFPVFPKKTNPLSPLFYVTFDFSSRSFQNGTQPSSSVRVSAGRGGGDGEEGSHGRGGGELGP